MCGSTTMRKITPVMLADWIRPGDIDIAIDVTSKVELLDHLASKASTALNIDKRQILSRLNRRESLGSTGFGSGVALPHSSDLASVGFSRADAENIEHPYVALGRLTRPIEFEAVDGLPVDIVCMVLVPKGNAALALRILSGAARALKSRRFTDAFRAATTPQQVYAALVNEEKPPEWPDIPMRGAA